jgi:hypothetical protein
MRRVLVPPSRPFQGALIGVLAAACLALACGGSGSGESTADVERPPVVTPPAQDPIAPPADPGPTPPAPPEPSPTPTPPPADEPPVAFGTPGPWPIENAVYGVAQGIQELPVVAMSTDEAQNRWVATHAALYLFTPGSAAPRRFTAADGLHLMGNPVSYCETVAGYSFGAGGGYPACPVFGAAVSPGILSLAGGRPNEVFVGYAGELYDPGPNGVEGDKDDPNRHTGMIDWVRLNADGTLNVVRLDMAAIAHGMVYWHNRSFYRLVYDHVVHPGSLYAGSNHGVTYVRLDRWRPQRPAASGAGFSEWVDAWLQEWLGDHLHAEAHERRCGPSGTELCSGSTGLLLGEWKGLALDANGDLWHAGKWAAGLISWVDSPAEWVARNGAAFLEYFTSDDGSLPFFPPGNVRDGVDMSAVAVTPDGRVWFASEKQGIASWKAREPGFQRYSATSLGLPSDAVKDLVALPDGRLAVAHPTSGVVLWDPATGDVKPVGGLPSGAVTSMELDAMVDPPTLHVATSRGAAALRVLP